jgi:hypothetical protein
MATRTEVNGAGHQCSFPLGHKKHGFVGIQSATPTTAPTSAHPTVEVHGYWNPQGYWEIWPVVPSAVSATD